MRLALRFWLLLLLWTGILLLMLVTVSLVSGQAVAEVLAHLPVWAALSLALAAFPAGVLVSPQAFPQDRLVPRRLLEVVVAAAAVSVFMLVLGNYLAPVASRNLNPGNAAHGATDPALMSLGQLRQAAREAVDLARRAVGTDAVRRWQGANRLVWHYVRRTDGTVLPLLFALVGLLTGFWSRRVPRRELQQAQQWAMGFFLVVSTYLVGENSYELIVSRSAGPVFFAGDLVLVVPVLLLFGMGWPTLVTLLGNRRPATETWGD
jgi:hypothetical protein